MAFDWDAWNVSSGAERVVLARVRYWDEDAAAAATLYTGSEPYFDETNGIQYDGTMVDVPSLQWGNREIEGGKISLGVGNLKISNIDDKYSYIFDNDDNNFYGRSIRFYVGPRGHLIADFKLVFLGYIDRAEWHEKYIDIFIRDNINKLNRSVQRNRMGNSSPIPVGARRQFKPMAYGFCKSVPPLLIHDTNWTYKVSDGAIEDAVTVIRRSGLNIAGSVSSEDATNGEFTLSSEPDGILNLDMKGAKPGGSYLQEMGDVLEEILTRSDDDSYEILQSSEVNSTSISALNTDCSLDVAIWFGEERVNCIDAFEKLMPLGYLWGFNRDGEFIAQTVKDPSGETSDHDIGDSDILRNGVSILETRRPNWKIVCRYNKNYEVVRDFKTGVSKTLRAYLSRNYRSVESKEDSNIKTAYSGAKTRIVSLMASGGVEGTGEELDRLFDLYSVRRRVYEVQAWAKPLSWEIGDIVTLTYPRFGLDAGKKLVFIGSENKLNSSKVTAYLWG